MEESEPKPRFSYAKAFPSDWLKEADLMGRDQTCTVESWRYPNSKDIGFDGKPITKGIVLSFVDREKEFVCNTINYAAIRRLHGLDPADWIGRKVTLYPTTCRLGRDPQKGCIRIRFQSESNTFRSGGAA